MSKKDEFKTFVKKHPELLREVKENNKSWQNLFEVYDLYGEDEESWSKYLNNSTSNTNSSNNSSAANLGELTKLIKNINIENVQKYIDTAQKAIGIVQELTKGNVAGAVASKVGPDLARPINKIFED